MLKHHPHDQLGRPQEVRDRYRVNPITATTVVGHQSVDELGAIAFVIRRGRGQ